MVVLVLVLVRVVLAGRRLHRCDLGKRWAGRGHKAFEGGRAVHALRLRCAASGCCLRRSAACRPAAVGRVCLVAAAAAAAAHRDLRGGAGAASGVRRRLLLLGLLLGRLLRCRCLRLVQELLLSEARGGRAWDASGCQIQVLPLGQEILRKLDARCVT